MSDSSSFSDYGAAMRYIDAAKSKRYGRTDKWVPYFEAYETHFAPYRDREVTLLEIGVQRGGGLATYERYFPNARVVGMDVDESCRKLSKHGATVYIGSQTDTVLLDRVVEETGGLDIVIDDGSHRVADVQATFRHLFPRLNDGGLYAIEDLHTSYWPEFGGGYRKEGSSMEFLKSLVDGLNFWAYRHERAEGERRTSGADFFEEHVASVHFYDSLCFLYKKRAGSYPDPPERVRI